MHPNREDLNRAYYLSTRRSTIELEYYLSKFYVHRALGYSAEKLRRYLQVLEMDDKMLQRILLEDEKVPPGVDATILKELKAFRPSSFAD